MMHENEISSYVGVLHVDVPFMGLKSGVSIWTFICPAYEAKIFKTGYSVKGV
jgi:hypothetical protein